MQIWAAGRRWQTLAASSLLAALAFAAGFGTASARDPLLRLTPLFVTKTTVMDEQIVYPPGQAQLTAAIIAMAPGAETGWHRHGVPLAGIVLEGELTVDYGPRGTRTYRTGDALAEAIDFPHNGRNSGTGPMRLFALFIGAEGIENTRSVSP
jgi:quercetin dioxygenase-like cupin family protein